MRNNLTDLNNYLFETLEALTYPELTKTSVLVAKVVLAQKRARRGK